MAFANLEGVRREARREARQRARLRVTRSRPEERPAVKFSIFLNPQIPGSGYSAEANATAKRNLELFATKVIPEFHD